MKKLLAMLTTITSLSSITPIILANASAEIPENKVINKEINYSQTNDLEKLIRSKRENIQKLGKQKIVITTNGRVTSSGIAFNNKLYFGSDDGKVYEYDPVTNQQKIVITTNDGVRSSGIAFNNKLYFGSYDGKVYEYDPVTNQQKIVITTNNDVTSSGIAFNNKLYFGSYDGKVYEYDPVTNQQKIVITTNNLFRSSGIAFNNKLYFGSDDGKVYEYDPVTNQQKIVITTNDGVRSSGIAFNNKLYFGSDDGKVYEYDPVTNQQKIVITTNNDVTSSGIAFNNKLYFGSDDGKVYEYDPVTNQQKIVITTNDGVRSSGIAFNNKLYFGSWDNNVYEYDPVTNQQKIVITTNSGVISSGIVFNNKLYFGSDDGKVYEYDPVTNQQKVVITTNNDVTSSGIAFNNKLYFGSYDGKVYEYNLTKILSNIITINNLKTINNNSDEVILNELNYLNPELDTSQLEVTNKTNISAIIRAKADSDKYFGEKKINYVINQQKNVNLDELIKKAIFFKFRDDNPNLIFKEIKDINTDNLQYSNIELTQKLTPTFTKDIYLNDCSGESNFENETSSPQKLKTKECRDTLETEKRIKLAKGLGRTQSHEQTKATSSGTIKSSEISDVFENSDITTSSMSHGWTAEVGGKILGAGASGGARGEYGSSNTESSSHTTSSSKGKTNTSETSNINSIQLMNNVNLENTDEKVISKSIQIVWPSQEITINPNTKTTVSFIINKISYQTTLDLKQDIYGNIQFNILTKNNETVHFDISIGKLMQKLQQYNLLPQEIGLYDDGESVYFDGKLQFSIKKAFQENIKVKEQEL